MISTKSDAAYLTVNAALTEYTSLRQEIMQIRSRQSQLVVFVGAGIGALITSTYITTSNDKALLASILMVAALVVCAAIVNYVGYGHMIMLIGSYLVLQAQAIQSTLNSVDPVVKAPAIVFTWDRMVARNASAPKTWDNLAIWGPASFELLAMFFLAGGLCVIGGQTANQNGGTPGVDGPLFWLTVIAIVATVIWTMSTLPYSRDRVNKVDACVEALNRGDPARFPDPFA